MNGQTENPEKGDIRSFENIALIGYRAAGKTTLARALAELSDMPLFSSDELIVEGAGMPIADLLALHGWPHFRRREERVLQTLARRSGIVIDCGGGAATLPESMQALARSSLIVHVDAQIEIIRSRLHAAPRPLLAAANVDDDIASTYEVRQALYRRWADVRVDSSNSTAEALAESVWRSFSQFQAVYERKSTR